MYDASTIARFRSHIIEAPAGCLIWQGKPNASGYGHFRVGGRAGRTVYAHRVAYQIDNGPIPDGKVLDHLCRTRLCVNPLHLEVVDPETNTLRGESRSAINARKTHCDSGHELSAENTYIKPRGGRQCRECARDQVRRYRERKRRQ